MVNDILEVQQHIIHIFTRIFKYRCLRRSVPETEQPHRILRTGLKKKAKNPDRGLYEVHVQNAQQMFA